jgi:hypothetical protein
VSNLRSQLCRQLKKAAIILVNSLAEMEEIATMKKIWNLGAEVKVSVARRVNHYEYKRMKTKAKASGVTVEY